MCNIEQLLQRYVSAPVECDGFTRIAYSVLKNNNISCHGYGGQLTYTPKGETMPHLWLELPDGKIIDYRARMWFPYGEEIPHGIFHKSNYPNVVYDGSLIYLEVLSDRLIEFLCC